MNELQNTEITQIELEINFYKEQTARNIIEIGKRLIKAKELVPYGEWGKWLDNKVEFSQSMASKFMKVAIEFGDSESIPKVGLSKLIMLTSVSQEERESFIEENPVEDMTTRELRQAIKEKKELEKELEETKCKHNDLLAKKIKLENQEPIVIEKEIEKIIEVIPDDYEDLKTNQINKVDKQDFNRLRKEFEEKIDENHELKNQIKHLSKTDSKAKHQEKLKDNVLIFATRIHTFLNDVGGLAWLTEYIEELDEYDKRSYYKALDLLEGWVMTVKSNINKEEL